MTSMKVGTLRTGFTIVELLIVVVVIAVLAAVTIVAYNGIQQRAKVSALKTELASIAKAMELAKISNNDTYPTTLPSGVSQSSSTVLSLSQSASGFCINGNTKNNLAVQWRYDSSGGGLQEGLCPGQVISGSEQGLNPNLLTSQNFTSGWTLNAQTPAGRTLTTRSGATGDPYPTRPVLVLTNSATTSNSWGVIQSTGVSLADILNGQSYTRGVWVRKIGNYVGTIGMFGILDGNGLNVTLGNAWMTFSTDWQYLSMSAAPALQNAPGSNTLYLSTQSAAYTTSGWSIEFQGFELRRV